MSKKRLFIAFVTFYADTRIVTFKPFVFKNREDLYAFVSGFTRPFYFNSSDIDRILVQKWDYGKRWDNSRTLTRNEYMVNLRTNKLEDEIYEEKEIVKLKTKK